MAHDRDHIYELYPSRVPVGTSQVIGITVVAGLNATAIKWFSGGSLEIIGSTQVAGQGWLLGTGEIFNWDNSATFYLTATGATAICMVIRGRSAPGY